LRASCSESAGRRYLGHADAERSFQEGGAVVRGLIESTGEPLLPLTQAILGAPVRDHTAGEVWRLASRREAHRRAFMALWQSAELDVLLCPAAPLPAPRPGRVSLSGRSGVRTSTDNLLRCATGGECCCISGLSDPTPDPRTPHG
jgi:Asp-tRNA(Asn)/Glu-tRNA(Gln) amidotransferase A subunit family amidase